MGGNYLEALGNRVDARVRMDVRRVERRWGLLLMVATVVFSRCAFGDESSPQAIVAELRSGNFEQALTNSDALLAKNPGDPMLRTLRGLALRGLGRWNDGLASFDRVLKADPDFSPALEAAAETAYLHKDARAAGYLERLLRLQPENDVANAMAGALAYEHHQCKVAIAHFQHSTRVLAQNQIGVSQYSACLLENNRAREAVSILARESAAAPAIKNLQYNLAVG